MPVAAAGARKGLGLGWQGLLINDPRVDILRRDLTIEDEVYAVDRADVSAHNVFWHRSEIHDER